VRRGWRPILRPQIRPAASHVPEPVA
jgi:hypothetical protein